MPPAQPAHGSNEPGLDAVPHSTLYKGRFGRMFRNLPPHVPDPDLLSKLAETMVDTRPGAKPGGSWKNNRPTGDDGDHPDLPAIHTYFAQFLDHDITFDLTSSLQRRTDPDALHNFRTPRLDLDSLYGGGPERTPYLYDSDDRGKLLLDTVDGGRDLPRNSQGRALIGDPRNDVHVIIAQLHRAFAQLHNHFVDQTRQDPTVTDAFAEAQRLTSWHYQWIVLNDFLPRIVGEVATSLLPTPTRHATDATRPSPDLAFFNPKRQAFMPVEFSVGAYRFGHSMVRAEYVIRDGADPLPILAAAPDGPSLTGHRRLTPDLQVQWHHLTDVDGKDPAIRARRIDMRMSDPLTQLPPHVFGDDPEVPRSLILRNLQRGVAVGLPSGQDVARAMCLEPLTVETFDQAATFGLDHAGWHGHWPLWAYILAEATQHHDGTRLGPVGARNRRRGHHRADRQRRPQLPGRQPLLDSGGQRPHPDGRARPGGRAVTGARPVRQHTAAGPAAGMAAATGAWQIILTHYPATDTPALAALLSAAGLILTGWAIGRYVATRQPDPELAQLLRADPSMRLAAVLLVAAVSILTLASAGAGSSLAVAVIGPAGLLPLLAPAPPPPWCSSDERRPGGRPATPGSSPWPRSRSPRRCPRPGRRAHILHWSSAHSAASSPSAVP